MGILENAYLPYVCTVFYEKIVRVDDATANYSQLLPVDVYKIRLREDCHRHVFIW